jgi:hypothetical protein
VTVRVNELVPGWPCISVCVRVRWASNRFLQPSTYVGKIPLDGIVAARLEARYAFFESLDDLVPELRHDLTEKILPHYSDSVYDEYADWIVREDPDPHDVIATVLDEKASLPVPVLLIIATDSIVRSFNLRDPWILDSVHASLKAAAGEKEFQWVHSSSERSYPKAFYYQFSSSPWDPNGDESFSAFVKRLKISVAKDMDGWEAEITALMDEEEWESATFKTVGNRNRSIGWLIREQVKDESQVAIARADGIGNEGLGGHDQSGRGHVAREIKRAARILGFSLRSRGEP